MENKAIELHNEIIKALNDNDIEKVDTLLKQKGDKLTNGEYSKEELNYFLENNDSLQKVIDEKMSTLKDLIIKQNKAQKVANKYLED